MLTIAHDAAANTSFCGKTNRSAEALRHHQELLDRYLCSHKIRNHSDKTQKREEAFLNGWFEQFGFLTWEAMAPIIGRQNMIDYANTLIDAELAAITVIKIFHSAIQLA